MLSTDWFLPFWSLIDINSEPARQCFQTGCRHIVRAFVGSASSYYHITFSSDRIGKTKQDLLTLARDCKFTEGTLTTIEALLVNVPDRAQLGKTSWLFRHLHDDLMADVGIDQSTKGFLEDTRRKFFFMDDLQLQEACLQSRTKWDSYIRSLTADIPDSLANLVSEDWLTISELKYLLQRLTPTQCDQLHARFCVLATARTGLNLERDWSALLS